MAAMSTLCDQVHIAVCHNPGLQLCWAGIALQSTRHWVTDYQANLFVELERPTLVHKAGTVSNQYIVLNLHHHVVVMITLQCIISWHCDCIVWYEPQASSKQHTCKEWTQRKLMTPSAPSVCTKRPSADTAKAWSCSMPSALTMWRPLMVQAWMARLCQLWKKKKKRKTTTFGVNLMRSQVWYQAAQVPAVG